VRIPENIYYEADNILIGIVVKCGQARELTQQN
jgi:hypothetical protein